MSKRQFSASASRAAGEAMIRYMGGTLTIKAPNVRAEGDMVVTGDLTVNGNLTVQGEIVATGDVTGAGVSLANHTHTDSMGGGTTPPG